MSVYRAPIRPWVADLDTTTVRRWPVPQQVEPHRHSEDYDGAVPVPAGAIIARERWRAEPHSYACRYPECLCLRCGLWQGHPVHRADHVGRFAGVLPSEQVSA